MTTLVRWVTVGALFAIPFVVLLVDRSLYFPYVTARGFAFRVLVEVAFAGWALLALGDRTYRPRGSWIAVSLGLYVVWLGIADAASINPHKAFWGNLERMEGWISLAHLFAFFLVASAILRAENLWHRWWLTFVAASSLVCVYGILQLAHLARIAHDAQRLDALTGNPEFLGGYLLFAITMTLWLAASARRPIARCCFVALALMQTMILVQSGTRGALVGLIAAVGLNLIAWIIIGGKKTRAAGILALFHVPIAIIAFLVVRDLPIFSANPTFTRFTHFGLGELQVRFKLWHMAIQGFLTHPILGWGHEGFSYVFNRYYDPTFTAVEPWFDRAHNVGLDVLITGGLPGLLFFLSVLGGAAWALWRAPVPRAERIILLGGLLAYGIQGLVVFDSLMTSLPLFALLAFAHSLKTKPLSPSDPISFPWIRSSAICLILFATIWTLNVPTWRSSRDLVSALAPRDGGPMRLGDLKTAVDRHGFADLEVIEKLAEVATVVAGASEHSTADRQRFLAYAISRTQSELAKAPHEARLRLQLAKLYRSVGQSHLANREITVALKDAPKHPQLLAESKR